MGKELVVFNLPCQANIALNTVLAYYTTRMNTYESKYKWFASPSFAHQKKTLH